MSQILCRGKGGRGEGNQGDILFYPEYIVFKAEISMYLKFKCIFFPLLYSQGVASLITNYCFSDCNIPYLVLTLSMVQQINFVSLGGTSNWDKDWWRLTHNSCCGTCYRKLRWLIHPRQHSRRRISGLLQRAIPRYEMRRERWNKCHDMKWKKETTLRGRHPSVCDQHRHSWNNLDALVK